MTGARVVWLAPPLLVEAERVRIIAGSARGRALKTPKGSETRPTSDRVRESIFNILGQWLEGGRVLDLYAGTGALAFEALSRGAERAVLVDRSREAIALCRENAAALGFTEQVEMLAARVDATSLRRAAAGGRFALIFADPPYAEVTPAQILELLAAADALEPEGRVVLEHDRRREAPATAHGFRRVDQRRFGDTLVSFYVLDVGASGT